jgi:hypothetical protein
MEDAMLFEFLQTIKDSTRRTEDKLARLEQNYTELLAKMNRGVK